MRANSIILIGAPSGAGKTTLATMIIARQIDLVVDDQPLQAADRFDIKRLPTKIPGQCIVECCTNKLDLAHQQEPWSRLMSELPAFDNIAFVDLVVPKARLAAQYARRMLTEPRGLSILKPRPWKQTLRYLLTDRVERSRKRWMACEAAICAQFASRTSSFTATPGDSPFTFEVSRCGRRQS